MTRDASVFYDENNEQHTIRRRNYCIKSLWVCFLAKFLLYPQNGHINKL